MSARLARLALGLYPLAYRRRYGEEMRALLEDQPPGRRTVIDLLKGALRAHLRPADAPAGVVDAADRVRASTSAVLLCWVFVAAAGLGYYKTTEDFSIASRLHPLLRGTYLAAQLVAGIASVTVVLGALPLILAALARAPHDPRLRRTVALAVLPLMAFGGLTGVVVAVAHATGPHGSSAGNAVAIAWGIIGLACAIACVQACRAALFQVPVGPTELRIALRAATVVAGAMLTIAAAIAVYAIALSADASPLGAQSNGPFGLLSVTASLIVQVIVMAGAGGLATIATSRAWRAGSPSST